MSICNITIMDSNNQKLLGYFPDKETKVVQNINKGAKPLRGGRGNPTLGFFGGDNSIEVTLYDIASECKAKETPLRNVNIILDGEAKQFQFEKVDAKLENSNVIFKCEKFISITK